MGIAATHHATSMIRYGRVSMVFDPLVCGLFRYPTMEETVMKHNSKAHCVRKTARRV